MAKSRLGGKRSRAPFFDMNKINHEIRMIMLAEGNGIVGELAQRVAEEARSLAPALPGSETPRGPNKRGGDDKAGPLKSKIFAQPSAYVPNSWIVCSPVWYSHFVEYGTEPHEMPRAEFQEKGKKMAFPGTNKFAGKTVVTDWVHHPKVRQKPFLRPAADKAEQFLQQIITERHS